MHDGVIRLDDRTGDDVASHDLPDFHVAERAAERGDSNQSAIGFMCRHVSNGRIRCILCCLTVIVFLRIDMHIVLSPENRHGNIRILAD